MFDQIGAGYNNLKGLINNFNPNKSAQENLGNKIVFPQTRQLGSALPPQPGSLSSLLRQNKGYVGLNGKTNLPSVGTNPGVLHQTPKTAVKSIKTPDGTTTTYHAPVDSSNVKTPAEIAQATGQNAPTYNSSGDYNGQIAGSTSTIKPEPYLDANGNPTTTNPGLLSSSPSQNTTFPGLISSLTDTSTQPNATQSVAQAGLLKTAQPGSDYQDIKNQIAQNLEKQKQLQTNYAEANKNLDTSGLDASLATGQENVLARTLAAKEGYLAQQGAGLSSQLAAANQQQGVQQQGFNEAGGLANAQQQTQQSGLTSAAGLAQPIQVSPGTSVVNPQTMQEGYSGIGGLTGLGIAQQNIKQGQQFAQQSADLGVALQGINTTSKFANDFLAKSGLNQSSSPFFNQQQNTTLGQLKAGDIGTYNELVNQIQTYANQIFQSTGMTPTDAGNLAKGISIDGMTQTDLKGFLSNLDTLGNARKAILDTASKSSYGSGTTPYTGATATGGKLQTTNSGAPFLPSGEAGLQAIAGGAINFGGDILSLGGAIKAFLGF